MDPQRGKRMHPGVVDALVGIVPDCKLARIVADLTAAVARGETVKARPRRHLADGLHKEVDQLITSVPLSLKNGGDYTWRFLEPNRLLAHVVQSCPELAAAYGRAANEHMPTREHPWD